MANSLQMGATSTGSAAAAVRAPLSDPRAENAKPQPVRFAMLAGSLCLLLLAFRAYGIEQPSFFKLACLVFGGFAVNYWLPFRLKEPFVILLSLAGACILLPPLIGALLIGSGLVLFAIVRIDIAYRWKLALLLASLAILTFGRATGRFPVPREFWGVFGAMFMFRMIVYLYDLKHRRDPANLREYLSYFFLLPNYYFLLFPVVDFQTFRKSYFKRDIHLVAQQGVWWIVRGTTQLLLYRLIYQLQGKFSPPHVSVATAVVMKCAFCYLLYVRVSGQFHIIAGMLCLFGYDLPATNRKYLLASSINDLWKRINIYWKDFMVKIVYFPAYFRLRRGGELRAQLLSTMAVFLVTWILHAWQFFWLQGKFLISMDDSIFWTILGSAMMLEVWVTYKRPKRAKAKGWAGGLRHVVQIAATFAFMSLLWSLWSANSMGEWLYFLKSGNV